MRSLTYLFLFTLSLLSLQRCGGPSEDPFAVAATAEEEHVFSVEDAFRIIAEENEQTRTLYTSRIVGLGKQAGIEFHEDWKDEAVEAGPLPALFLRGTSEEIRRTDVPLGLYLGSDFPIVQANKFQGIQAEKFATIRETKEPEFFYDEENQLYTAMFPDFAMAAPCVSCHNDHKNTSKRDWALGDIMGATTWTYPQDSLTMDEMLGLVKAYRMGVENTYETFLAEIREFQTKQVPTIGEQWSDSGYAVPDKATFMTAVNREVAPETLERLLSYVKNL